MQGYLPTATFPVWWQDWSTIFAQETDEDLDFDEGLEDDDLDQPKPPSRRPLLLILVLLIAVGIGYWALQPDLTSLFQNGTSQKSHTSMKTREVSRSNEPVSPFSKTISAPHFQEGQRVFLATEPGSTNDSFSLQGNALGTKQGPTVRSIEPLAIVDGEMVNRDWVYLVQTESGKTGWISEKKLRERP